MTQELIYLSNEADDFYARNKSLIESDSDLRESKLSILQMLESYIDLSKVQSTLEIGCCIGDLLHRLQDTNQIEVFGIEPSRSACDYAAKRYGLKLENTVFTRSHFFGLSEENKNSFDLIILDDVLCWFSRELLLPAMASIDWLLRPGGHIFIRDFAPSFSYAFRNHHQTYSSVYNFKVKSGHASFFLETGMYYTTAELRRRTSGYQVIKTNRPDSTIWTDVIVTKLEEHSYPVLTH